jgi:hypothetical protein
LPALRNLSLVHIRHLRGIRSTERPDATKRDHAGRLRRRVVTHHTITAAYSSDGRRRGDHEAALPRRNQGYGGTSDDGTNPTRQEMEKGCASLRAGVHIKLAYLNASGRKDLQNAPVGQDQLGLGIGRRTDLVALGELRADDCPLPRSLSGLLYLNVSDSQAERRLVVLHLRLADPGDQQSEDGHRKQ